MIEILDKHKCSGCGACLDVCPKNAISMSVDKEGFWYPKVDKDKCVDCSLCNKVCPIEHKVEAEMFAKPECYAAVNKNLFVRFDSTSGGAFSALANCMFKQKGVVGGAATDSEFNAHQILIHNKSDLEKIRSSKYYQSDATGFYQEVENQLKAGKPVLVCGSPCQMAGLRGYLRKDYEKLIIVDFICLCMPSPKVFKKYIQHIEQTYGFKVVETKAKCKELGWRNLTQMFVLENGAHVYQTHDNNPFQFFYMTSRTCVRPVCYECPFKGFPRCADITIGDYWQKEKGNNNWDYIKNFDYDAGTSIVLANNSKGLAYLEKCKNSLKLQKVSLDSVLEGNLALTVPIKPSTIDREKFFEELEKTPFGELYNRYKSNFKNSIKDRLKKYYRIVKQLRTNLPLYYQLLRYNGLKNIISKDKALIIPLKYSRLSFDNLHNIKINGNLVVGTKRLKKSHRETILFVEDSASLTVNGKVEVGYGSDIEVFKGGKLTLGRCWMNCNAEIVCTNSISIGNYVGIGRNVCIRDNNGGHLVNRPYYKDERPVVIEDKVWICSNATIMPGVTIGQGAIIGEGALVTENVPPYCMVSGNPAKVIDKDVLFNWSSGVTN